MCRRKKDRLRELTETERQERTRVIRSRVASANKFERARCPDAPARRRAGRG